MATIKDKMLEALAIYVAEVRDGRDAFASDEDVAAQAYSKMAQAAEYAMEPNDFMALTDLLFMEVEDYVEDTWSVRADADPADVAAALRVLAKALNVTL